METVLTLQSPAATTIETGCVALSGASSTTVGCGFVDSAVKTGAGQIGTPTLGSLGITSAADIAVLFNATEPAGNGITLNNLVLTIYSPTGAVLFTSGPSATYVFPSTAPGVGSAGFLFALDAMQANEAQAAAFGAGSQDNRIGLGTSLSDATGGVETFSVAARLAAAIPEPASLSLIAFGVAGFVWRRLARREHRR
jgi:hypothetical protein